MPENALTLKTSSQFSDEQIFPTVLSIKISVMYRSMHFLPVSKYTVYFNAKNSLALM